MSDWSHFHAAVLAGTRQRELPDACDRAWQWLDLSVEERRSRTLQGITSETAARWMLMAAPFVRSRLHRDAATDPATAARRYAAVQEICDVVTTRFPAVAQTPAPLDARQEALNNAVTALMGAMRGCTAGSVTPASAAALATAIDAFAAVAADWQAPLPTDHAWWMGAATVELGRAELELGHVDAARAAFERAERHYIAAGSGDHVAECRERLRALAEGRSGNFDSAASRQLRILVEERDPLRRAEALTTLAGEMRKAGDRHEASRLAEDAARILAAVGYADPEPDPEHAVHDWIDTARLAIAGDALLGHLASLARQYAEVLGARAGIRSERDPEGVDRAQRCLLALGRVFSELFDEADAAHQSVNARLEFWLTGSVSAAAPTPASADAERVARRAALDDALYRLRLDCNAHPRAELLDVARRLQHDAQALDSRLHLARARYEEAYLLLALERHADAVPAVDAAQRTLLGERAPSLGAFTTTYERGLYIECVTLKARALAALRDHATVLALCEPVVCDIESERARVSSPYQQSAFLGARAELYEFCAAAAYHLKRWDLLLSTTELLKARASLRTLRAASTADARDPTRLDAAPAVSGPSSRLDTADDPHDLAAIERSYRDTTAALAAAARGSASAAALIDRRRWLADARAIALARTTAGGLDPAITVATVQQALAADEAAVSWFWVGGDVLLVQAFTCDAHDTALVVLDAAQRAQYETYLDAIRAFSGPAPAYDTIVAALDTLIPALASVLLPSSIQRFVAGRPRLILCAHRTLHLFPFHAARSPAGWLIERHAVRYVPNLSSLLVPWKGRRDGPVLAVGIGAFDDPGVTPLPNAEAEARAVAAAHREHGRVVIRPTRAEFTALPLADFRCLHLATHGSSVLAGDALNDPLRCGIELADGTLDGWDIAALRLPAELVVLAACHSGQRAVGGRGLAQLPGDDMFGLQSVLFESGAGTLLGALWPVDDESAQAILVDFHRAYAAGAAPDLALQAALKAHLAEETRRHDLYDWAPFFLTSLGNPRLAP